MSLDIRIENILTRSVDRNLLMFDHSAPCGVLTLRLIRLMKIEYIKLFDIPMRFLFIPPKSMGNFANDETEDHLTINEVYIDELTDFYNLDVKDLLTNKLKAVPVSIGENHSETDKEFVLGFNVYPFNELNDSCECLLGSF